ncbi:MAG: DUF1097 domain-containing protein [Eubacteriales bacterium]
MKTILLKTSIVVSVLVAVVSGGYYLLPLEVTSVLWCVFVGLAVTFASGADVKQVPNYILSEVSGIIWGYIYFFIIGWFMSNSNMSAATIMFWVVLIVTIIVVCIHMILLKNTWFNQVPLVFSALACYFAVQGNGFVYVGLSLILGTFIAVGTNPIVMLFTKKEVQKIDV